MLGALAGKARELRAQLVAAQAELKAGRLVGTATLLERAIRQLDDALAEAKRAGVV